MNTYHEKSYNLIVNSAPILLIIDQPHSKTHGIQFESSDEL